MIDKPARERGAYSAYGAFSALKFESRESVIEEGSASRHVRGGLIALMALLAHLNLRAEGSVIEEGSASRHVRGGLIALMALLAHLNLETGDPQPQSSLHFSYPFKYASPPLHIANYCVLPRLE
jgi:hypothetical protein